MKNTKMMPGLIGAIIAASLVPAAHAQDSDSGRIARLAASSASANANRKDREALITSIIVCSRDIVEGRKGGNSGVDVASELLTAARTNSDNLGELAKLSKTCETARKNLQFEKVSRDDQFDHAKELPTTSCASKALLEDFIKPRVSCIKGGIAASAALGFGVGVSIDGVKCDSSDGKSWLELSVGGGIDFGFLAEIDLNGRRDDRGRKDAGHNPFSTSTSESRTLGLLVALRTEDTTITDDSGLNGFGVGGGGNLADTRNHQLNIEIIPLGTSDGRLYRNLMGIDVLSCDSIASRDSGSTDGAKAAAFMEQAVQNSDVLAVLDAETGAPKQVAGQDLDQADPSSRATPEMARAL